MRLLRRAIQPHVAVTGIGLGVANDFFKRGHAPTAATMPMSRRQQLLTAADENDFAIIEDDYEFEMSFLSPPSPALKSLDRNGRVIYVGSFSKSLFPGLRLGYLVAPEPVIEAARELRSLMLRHPPGHLQRTAAYFLALGHYDALIMQRSNRKVIRSESPFVADVHNLCKSTVLLVPTGWSSPVLFDIAPPTYETAIHLRGML